jgi:hypothetical protein
MTLEIPGPSLDRYNNVAVLNRLMGWEKIIKYFFCNNCFHLVEFSRFRGCRSHDRMVVGFTTTCVISAYHH